MVGPSGAGKTTLLRLLNRLDDPDGGAVLLGMRDVREYDVLELRRRVQVVGQVPVAFPGTVADNVGRDAASLLARVGLDPALASRDADRLSVGEAQRMCLARSLALRPRYWRWTSRPRPWTRSAGGVEQLIRHLAETGLTVVMVTHDSGRPSWRPCHPRRLPSHDRGAARDRHAGRRRRLPSHGPRLLQ